MLFKEISPPTSNEVVRIQKATLLLRLSTEILTVNLDRKMKRRMNPARKSWWWISNSAPSTNQPFHLFHERSYGCSQDQDWARYVLWYMTGHALIGSVMAELALFMAELAFQWRKKLMNWCVSILDYFFNNWIQLILDFSDL